MPPGVVAPETPPFEPKVSKEVPKPLNETPATPPASPFADPSEPVESSGTDDWDISSPESPAAAAVSTPETDSGALDPFGSNAILSADSDSGSTETEGENKTLAIVSLVSGIASFLCCFLGFILGPVALITGFMARSKISQDPANYGGGTLALVGMILGVVGTILFVVWLLFSILGNIPQLINSLQ
jgi:hypothetical protein